MNPFYVTTPIYYVNDVPHLGHAYTTIVADTLARFHRARGQATSSSPAPTSTARRSRRPRARRARRRRSSSTASSARFQDDLAAARHRQRRLHPHDRAAPRAVRAVALAAHRASTPDGDIYLGAYEGLYCVGCEGFYTEAELENGRCPQHPDRELKLVKEPSYFFRMSAYADRLVAHIEAHPDFIQPDYRRNEVLVVRARRPARPLDLAHHVHVGHPGARRRRSTSSTCGSTRSPTTSARSATPESTARFGAALAATPSTSSARTSSASTRSTGRRC